MPNAITILKSDHAAAKRLLRELNATGDRAVKERERLVSEIERELKTHAQIRADWESPYVLPIHQSHVRVAVAGRYPFRRHLVDSRHLFGRQLHIDGSRVLFEMRDRFAARDRHDVVTAVQQPRDGELRRRDALLFRDPLDLFHEREILREVLALKSRRVAPIVSRFEVVDGLVPARQKSTADRAVRDEADPQLAHRGQNVILGITAPERVLRLQRRDRMHLVRAPNRR